MGARFDLKFSIIEPSPQEIPSNTHQRRHAVVAGITPNLPPDADAGGPYAGSVGEEIMLNAGLSHDADGSIVRYEWDLDGDGSYDLQSTQAVVAYTWLVPFDGSIGLRVTDDEGVTDIDYASANIQASVCPGDFEPDGDVDGVDLFDYSVNGSGVSLEELAGNFGKERCQ
jgi:hypothetical protein